MFPKQNSKGDSTPWEQKSPAVYNLKESVHEMCKCYTFLSCSDKALSI